MTRPTAGLDLGTQIEPLRTSAGAPVSAHRAPAGERLAYLDNLKTLLIAGIIASHAINGYAEFGSWTYQDVREGSLSSTTELVFVIANVTLGGLFLMALFFLISGLFTHDSLVRKGPSRFVSDRLLRLGVPFAAYTLVVWPLLEYSLFGPFRDRPFWDSYLDSDPYLDNGPMWFVGVLLLFSLGLVGWWRLRPPKAPSAGPLRWRHLVLFALAVGLTTFTLRIGLPANSNQFLNLHMWAWPEYLAMFGLGVVAARNGWLRPVPRELARRCGIATVVAMLVVGSFVGSAEPLGIDEEAYFGGFGLLAFLAAMGGGVLAVAAPVWVLAFVQRHLNGTGRLRKASARSSYAAFMLQGPVLVALAVALRPTALPVDFKAVLVATLGVVGSFALAWPLVTRTPLRRFL